MVLKRARKTSWVTTPPSAYDIVTCRFPIIDGAGKPKLRPGLVLNVLKGRTTGNIVCRVAYGTSSLKIPARGNIDLIIQNSTDMNAIGLPMATRFDLDSDKIILLPWTAEYFDCWKGYSSPRIGCLNEDYIKDYAYLMMKRSSS